MTRILLALLTLLGACRAVAPPAAPVAGDLVVLEACCRWYVADQLERGGTSQILFVEAAPGVDAPEALLERLRGLGVRAAPASRAVEDAHLGVVERDTREPGVMLRVRALAPLADGRVEVRFLAYGGPEGAEGATLTLVREGALWRVLDARERWIS